MMRDGTRRALRSSLVGCGLSLLVLVTGACGGGDAPPGVRGQSSPATSVTVDTSSVLPTTEMTTTTRVPETTETGDTESTCATVYANRGVPPFAQSRDLDDQMALEAKWHADLIAEAGEQLSSDHDAIEQLYALMEEAYMLNVRAAQLYAEHVLISQELDAINARLDEMEPEVLTAAEDANAPSCARLILLP